MKTPNPRSMTKAFGRADLTVVIASILLLAIIFSVLLSALSRAKRRDGHAPRCLSNLKQISLSFRIFANDHDEHYPFAVSNLTNEQTGIFLTSNTTTARAWMHYQSLANELQCGRVLICPQDTKRLSNYADDFLSTNTSLSHPTKRDLAVSYFVGLYAEETKAQSILAGDRQMCATTNGPVYSTETARGAIQVGESSVWANGWPPPMHRSGGYVALGDGSVQQMTTQKLQQQLAQATNSYGTNINLLLFPQ